LAAAAPAEGWKKKLSPRDRFLLCEALLQGVHFHLHLLQGQ
jgi:hypothetical protein